MLGWSKILLKKLHQTDVGLTHMMSIWCLFDVNCCKQDLGTTLNCFSIILTTCALIRRHMCQNGIILILYALIRRQIDVGLTNMMSIWWRFDVNCCKQDLGTILNYFSNHVIVCRPSQLFHFIPDRGFLLNYSMLFLIIIACEITFWFKI